MGKRNQRKTVEIVKSRKDVRKNKRLQKKANRANFQKQKKEMRIEFKNRQKNNTGKKKKQPVSRGNEDQDDEMDHTEFEKDEFDNYDGDDNDDDGEDIASDFELSDEEMEQKAKQVAMKNNVKLTKPAKASTPKLTQLEQDHQRLLKNEKDLKKQMGKQRINQLKLANEDEDKNIKKLEKLLKINKTKGAKKIPKSFNDGLDYALELCLPENIEKMCAAAKEAAEAGESDNDDWKEDLALATGKESDEKKENKKKKNDSTDEIKAHSVQKKKMAKLKKIDKKYFGDSDSDSDFSDLVDSEFGDSENGGNSDSDANEELSNTDEDLSDDENLSDDEAPEEVQTKSKSSFKRRLEKEKQATVVQAEKQKEDECDLSDFENGDPDDDDSMDDNDDEDLLEGEQSDESMDDSNSEEAELAEEKTTKKPDVWEDIYGRKRDKTGNVIEDDAPKKYVPPHLRARLANASTAGSEMDADPVRREKLNRLKRVLKGFMNRLSEANMHKITTDIDNLYMQNPRHDMNETLTELLFDALISRVSSLERMVLDHMLLIAALHANVGSEVGAHILQFLITKLDTIVQQGIETLSVEDKTLDNILLVLCHMYTFRIFKCSLIYELLELLSKDLTEKSVECILLILKSIGFALRKDDPSKLKDFIIDLQKKSNDAPEEMRKNSRLKYMLDTLLAIKNNNMNKIPQYDPTVAEHLRKVLKTLLVNNKYVTTLNISLADLLNADNQGKWWVVGSAWTGHINPVGGTSTQANGSTKNVQRFSEKLLELARKQRMNTEDRRNVFCILMSAEDYVDAFEKLLQLAIKDHAVIISVILHCCLAEKKFNPYYAVVGVKFADYDRKYKLALQFGIWDRIRDLGLYTNIQLGNFAKFVHYIITNDALSISVLKVIEFGKLEKSTLRFVRQLLLSILLGDERICIEVFQRVSANKQLKVFKDSLRLFMHHFLIKSGQKNGVPTEHLDLVQERVLLIDKHLNTSIIQF